MTEVVLPYVSFRYCYRFSRDGLVVSSDSTLRFRNRDEIEESLATTGFRILEVRDAPDRPGESGCSSPSSFCERQRWSGIATTAGAARYTKGALSVRGRAYGTTVGSGRTKSLRTGWHPVRDETGRKRSLHRITDRVQVAGSQRG